MDTAPTDSVEAGSTPFVYLPPALVVCLSAHSKIDKIIIDRILHTDYIWNLIPMVPLLVADKLHKPAQDSTCTDQHLRDELQIETESKERKKQM